MSTHVSVILNAHNEVVYLWHAIKSVEAAIARFKKEHSDREVEFFIVADAVTPECRDVIEKSGVRYIETNHRDLGLARNSGVVEASGDYVCFIDADDVWGERWLSNSYTMAEDLRKQTDLFVLHPQIVVNFGGDVLWWEEVGSNINKDFSTFFITNRWTANGFAPRAVYCVHPYKPVGKGLGFEDWEFHARTIAHGVHHLVVNESVHFIRKKVASMSLQHATENRLIDSSAFFTSEQQPLKDLNLPPRAEISDWLFEDMVSAHKIENEIVWDAREVRQRKEYNWPSAPDLAEMHRKMISFFQENNATHVLYGWSQRRGGAESRLVHYANAVKENGGSPVIVFTDQKGDYEIQTDIPVLDVSLEQPKSRDVVFLRLMLDYPAVYHGVNSRAFYRAIMTNPRACETYSKLFCSMYALEKLPDGQSSGHASRSSLLAQIIEKTQARILTDNLNTVEELTELHGPAVRNRMCVAYTPIIAPALVLDNPAKSSRSVLFSGRLGVEKGLRRLLSIIQYCHEKNENIVFMVAGPAVDAAGVEFVKELSPFKSRVRYVNGYSKFEDLKPHMADVFLCTSDNEGLPTTVLEALANGVPVISMPCGGVKYLSEVNLMPAEATPEEWVRKIKNVKKSGSERAFIEKNFSKKSFSDALNSAGYFNGV